MCDATLSPTPAAASGGDCRPEEMLACPGMCGYELWTSRRHATGVFRPHCAICREPMVLVPWEEQPAVVEDVSGEVSTFYLDHDLPADRVYLDSGCGMVTKPRIRIGAESGA